MQSAVMSELPSQQHAPRVQPGEETITIGVKALHELLEMTAQLAWLLEEHTFRMNSHEQRIGVVESLVGRRLIQRETKHAERQAS